MNPIQARLFNEHRSERLKSLGKPRGGGISAPHRGQDFRCAHKPRRSETRVLVKPSASFAVLVCAEVLDSLVQFTFEPANHSLDEVANEVRMRPRLFYREAPRPGKIGCAKRVREEKRPPAWHSALAETVNEGTHPIREAEPAPTGCAMFSPSERPAGSAATEVAPHSRPLAGARHDAPVRVDRQRAGTRLHGEAVPSALEALAQQF